ncbi:MAG TPA: cation diffusion facilitator family transporter [Nitrososphaerales archaeon]|nr:cation diffusion facilitator family transporter [Nitrososphaerales archaeon]
MQDNSSSIKRKLTIALAIASAITLLEFFGGLVSNSIALLSDAGHVLSDVMAIALSLFAIRLANREHTQKLTYGYHRAEVLAALANGIMLAIIAVVLFREAYMRLLNPPSIDVPILLGVATIGLAANISMAFILKDAQKTSIGARSAFLHVFYDTISSVGVIIAGVIVAVTQIFVVDPIIAFMIAGLIVRGAVSILRESIHILLEGAPSGVNMQKIITEIKNVNGVQDIHDLHVWTISSGLNACSGHIMVKDQMVSESARIIDEIGTILKTKFKISHTTIQIESEKTIKDIKHVD